MRASGRPTAARRKFTHDIMQTSRSHHKAEWVRRQKNLFIADDTLVLHAQVAVMSYSGNTYCYAGSSSCLVAQTTSCLLACCGCLWISWEWRQSHAIRRKGTWKLVLPVRVKVVWPTKKEFVHLLRAFVPKGKLNVVLKMISFYITLVCTTVAF